MRFEVSYSTGVSHEVTLAGCVAVLGRDPGCDVVLNDSKCSRRHAVIEDTPEGLVIRDAGSANGVYVNERRVDRAFLQPGDTVRLGDVRLRTLAEIGETVIVAPDDVPLPPAPPHESLTQPPFPAPPLPAPEAAPRAAEAAASLPAASPPPGRPEANPPRRAQPSAKRPLTVTILVVLWTAFGPAASSAIVVTAVRLEAGGIEWTAAAVLSLLLIGGGLAMALGLRALAPWARHLQIASSYLGLLACPFTPLAVTSLLYMNRSEVRRVFEQREASDATGATETTFALSIVVMTLVGAALTAFTAFLLWPPR